MPVPLTKKKKKKVTKGKSTKKNWSRNVTEHSHAMDLKEGVFTLKSPTAIAKSVLASATRSHTRKASPHQSAMSMINFYINRAGSALSLERKNVLTQAKDELKKMK